LLKHITNSNYYICRQGQLQGSHEVPPGCAAVSRMW